MPQEIQGLSSQSIEEMRKNERMKRVFGAGKATSIKPTFYPDKPLTEQPPEANVRLGMMPISAKGMAAVFRGLKTRPAVNPKTGMSESFEDFILGHLKDLLRGQIQGPLARWGLGRTKEE